MNDITLGNGGKKTIVVYASPFCGEAFLSIKGRENTMKKLIAALLVLILAFAAVITGCSGKETPDVPETVDQSAEIGDDGYEMSFVFEVVDKEGKTTQATIHTHGGYVGEVLQELGYLEGEEGPYGLYIKDVNGITADYDKDGTYWALYINDEYSMTGVDQIEIKNGYVYSFRIETM